MIKKQFKADLALLFVALVWGVSFTVIKDALAGIGPYYFNVLRFSAAFIFLAASFWKRFRKVDRKTLSAGLLIGLFLFAGYAFQTVGLKYTSASKAGFITGMAVVLVPLVSAGLTRRLPGVIPLAGVASAAIGLAGLSLDNSLNIDYGDGLVFLCAVSYALHIILVGHYAPRHDPVVLTIIQVGVVAAASLGCAAFLEEMPASFSGEVWVALLVTALPATAFAFLIQNSVQRFTSPTHTAIIFTMEPVFAAACAWLLGGEILTLRQWAGSLLILVGMLVTELKSAPGEPGRLPRTAEGEAGQ
ncbi:EamA-like transporter family protein [Pelotomaculum schinkii]|uniref:EamA-like transporter family protein n=1 Tax=Pelotomaculum schinkii TaxID=78350 RepID=A0A4Y7RDW2_9FIRM|nr:MULTISPECIES: DMT family transporter [Pelotomaculum]TEB06969.1 EamA-like transporter family protein [Pelotomaculum schinkii]TEB16869.1 EamA-like transporter family protein [Pelotomaculum sp. FP]